MKAGLTGSQIAATLGQLQAERGALERQRTQLAAGAEHPAPVVPIGALARYDRPTPSLAGYDTLLEPRMAGVR